MNEQIPHADVIRIRQIYASLLRLCRPFITKEETVKFRNAFEHVLQFQQSKWKDKGSEYQYHSFEVARIALEELNLGFPSAMGSLLHNLVDDNKLPLSEVRKQYGEVVTVILEGLNKLNGIQTEKISANSDNFRTLYLTLVKDIRVILIKLAHRVYDMRHFELLPSGKKVNFLNEVYHIYIPIAHRLGLYQIKTELEELWMKYTHPDAYENISRQIVDSQAKRKVFIDDFVAPVEKELIRQNIKFTIKSRPKSIFSIWQKMEKQNVDFEQVYDLLAIRIIIDSPPTTEKGDCWRVYSIVTDIYQPNPKRLRDWISSPKTSGYESLHTTVMERNKKWVEVQIRSERMDRIAEKGLAAHWKYKEGAAREVQEEWLNRIRDVIENPDPTIKNANKLAGLEISSDQVFIFTPEGDLKKLKKGSTVLDFAYEIHSSVGDTCGGAKVNNRIVPLKYVLLNGDKVEIITSKNQKPKLDWLSYVATSKAKSKIKRAIKEEKFREADLGKEILKRKLRNRKIQFNDTIVDKLIKLHKLESSIDLYYLIAIEKIDLSNLKELAVEKAIEAANENENKLVDRKDRLARASDEVQKDFMVIDENISNLEYEMAKCCNPILGDPVFGFVTVTRGITIHRDNCPNAKQLQTKYDYRLINVGWRKTDENKTYLTTMKVTGNDEIGIMNNITQVISSDFKVNMVSLKVDTSENGTFNATFKLNVKDTLHLDQLIHKIIKIKGVKKAHRILTEE